MVIGHRYRMKINGFMCDLNTDVFTGTYKGVNPDIYSYYIQFKRYRYKDVLTGPFERNSISSYIHSHKSRLEFMDDKGKWHSIYSDSIISLEDITNPYLCRSIPIKYLLFGSIEERVKFAIQSRHYAILDTITYKSEKVMMISTGFFKFQEYIEYVHKLNKLLSQPGSVISL